jgi:hypothetical protein
MACGSDANVRNIVCLEFRAPVPGTGWGCAVCGLDGDGAIAVICDACVDQKTPEIREAFKGYARANVRVPIEEVKKLGAFDHDYSKHNEFERSTGL